MDNKKYFNQFIFRARIFAVLLAGFFFIPAARAQTGGLRPVENRFLLVFGTSADMKKRVPAVQKVLDNLFMTSMTGELHSGDSIGLWALDHELHAGFPLQYWTPEDAAKVDTDIRSFVSQQRYSKTNNFRALQLALDQLVQDSDRLTVLIFCDGETPISGTPYDNGINQIFLQRQAGQKNAKQPFVIVMRSQLGKYVDGCTVDFPPSPVNFPDFPPLPPPPPPPVPVKQPPAAPAKRVVQSIIMINTNTEAKPAPAPKLEVTNTPAPVAPSNPIVAPAMISTVQTNDISSSPENSGLGSDGAMALGAAFLIVAGGLTVFMLRRWHRSGSTSLITRSMKKR